MSKTVNVLFIVMILLVIFCMAYDTFYFKRRIFNERNKEPLIRVMGHQQGEMTYLVFISPNGEICTANYTVDSINYEISKKCNK